MSRRVLPLILLCTILVLTALLLWPRPGPAAATGGATAVSAGNEHTCVLTSAEGVKCWGTDNGGQLGDGGSNHNTDTPGDVCADATCGGTLSGVVAVSAGTFHTCALWDDNNSATPGYGVKCWGSNGAGQLGDGTTTYHLTPVDVFGLTSGVAAISVGAYHTCAVTTGGGVKCWGRNEVGQLGIGTTTNSTTPVAVPGLTGVVAVSAGTFSTCALWDDNNPSTLGYGVKCWGFNGAGELGIGASTGPETCSQLACSTSPVDVCADATCTGSLFGVAAVSAGGIPGVYQSHTCALTTAGGVKCWGRNNYGQIGDGQFDYNSSCGYCRTTPVDVCAAATCTGLLSGLAAVSAGGQHTCALTTDGGVKCWGLNASGQLGIGSNSGPDSCPGGEGCSTTPVDVCADVTCDVALSGIAVCTPALSGRECVSAGGAHTCALTTASGLKCWGWNREGELGIGTFTGPQVCAPGYCSLVPVDVSGFGPKPTPTPTPSPGPETATPAGTLTPTDTPPIPNTPTPTPPSATATPPSHNGDANKDGTTNAIDAALVLQYAAGLLPSINPSADVNEDGMTNALDALLILQYSAGLIDHLPV